MALNIKIDFEDRYEIKVAKSNFTEGSFKTTLKSGIKLTMVVRIAQEEHPLMENVFWDHLFIEEQEEVFGN